MLLVDASGDALVGGDGLRGRGELAGDAGVHVLPDDGRGPRHWTQRTLFGQLRYVHLAHGHLPMGVVAARTSGLSESVDEL